MRETNVCSMKWCFYSLIFSICVFAACSKEEETNEENYDCEFVQNDDDMDGLIDETERSIMQSCFNDPLTGVEEISSNLIGEWQLIGHGEGWVSTVSKPCAYITIYEDSLKFEFKSGYRDTITYHPWKVEEINHHSGKYYRFSTDPDYAEGLFINTFCEDYMYGDATPVDGNMYMYEKVK